MSTRATTTPAERIDLMLAQVQQFLDLDLHGEAIARARHALAQCEKELAHAPDPHARQDILTRRHVAAELLRRMGGKPLPSGQEHSTI